MVEYKNLNNISQKLKDSIPKMEGEVLFQMLNGQKNNDMDRDAREKEPILYGKTQIPTFARIKDPFANNGAGAVVNIGLPVAFDINGNATAFKPFLAGMHEGKFNGKFSLTSDKVEDQELYEIFWLLNENASNPHRDKSVTPLFKIVNYKQEAESKISNIDILRSALDKLKVMTDAEYEEFANSQNYTETDPHFIKAQVSDYAKTYPDKFLTILKDPLTKVKANVKMSIKNGIVTFDAKTKDVAVNGNKVMTIADKGDDYVGSIALWINSTKAGQNVYNGLLKQLQAAQENELVAEEKTD